MKFYKRGVQHHPKITYTEAKQLLRKWINEKILPAAVQEAESAGHKVIFTPPHYRDFEPIELVRACVKGAIARAYNRNSTLELVKMRLENEF